MYYADHLGLARVRDRLSYYATQLADETLLPAALIDRLAKQGGTFSSIGK